MLHTKSKVITGQLHILTGLTCEQYEESLPAVETGTDLPVSDAELEAHPYWEYSEQNLCGAQMPMQI